MDPALTILALGFVAGLHLFTVNSRTDRLPKCTVPPGPWVRLRGTRRPTVWRQPNAWNRPTRTPSRERIPAADSTVPGPGRHFACDTATATRIRCRFFYVVSAHTQPCCTPPSIYDVKELRYPARCQIPLRPHGFPDYRSGRWPICGGPKTLQRTTARHNPVAYTFAQIL
jgi:hypothetical protein